LVSRHANTAKLFVDDRREVIALSTGEKKCVSDVIRELVHEALRARRYHAIGRDEGEDFVRNIHRETLAAGISPLIAELTELRQKVEAFPSRVAETARPIPVHESPAGQAILSLISQVFSHVMISEHITKVLATIGMQKDNLSPDQVQAQLARLDQTGRLRAKPIERKILAEYGLVALSRDVNHDEENAE
jgi:hypothetical protein